MIANSQRTTDAAQHFLKNVLQVAGLLSAVLLAVPAHGQGLRGVVNDLVRGTARVTDELPAKKVDDLVTELAKSRAVRETVDAELGKAGRIAGGGGMARGAARSDEVLHLLRAATNELDPSVLRRIESLDEASREAAFILAKGGDELARTVPDLATRARLLREGGAETVAAVGIFGPDAARAALRLDEAIRGGSVIVKDGGRAVSVADFGSALTRFGDASWNFWKQYVHPHWKVWATSGALAAYLANPEYFQDAAGELTEAGFKHLTEFVGDVAAAAIHGIGKGSGSATEKVGDAMWETYFKGEKGVYAVIGTLVFVVGISLLFRRVRYWTFWPLRWLNRVPHDSKPSKP